MIIFLTIQIDVSRFYLPNRSPITLECWKWKILLPISIKTEIFPLKELGVSGKNARD